MDAVADEKELIRKLVFTGHLNVPERRALPDRKAKASLIYSVIEEALESGEWFWAWWLPDDSMIGCQIKYRGDGPTRVCWTYSGIEGERSGVTDYNSYRGAAEALAREARQFWGKGIDGVPIDWDA
jgi:hypothetical protein